MKEPRTQIVHPVDKPEEFTWEKNISARLANTEAGYIRLDQRVTDMANQILKIQLMRSEAEKEMAMSSIEKLDATLDEIRERRKQLADQKLTAKNPTESLMYEMMDDSLQQREARTLQDRDAAIITREKAKKISDGTSQEISAIKMRPPINNPPMPETPSSTQTQAQRGWIWFRDKVLPYFITGATLIVLNALWQYFKTQITGP